MAALEVAPNVSLRRNTLGFLAVCASIFFVEATILSLAFQGGWSAVSLLACHLVVCVALGIVAVFTKNLQMREHLIYLVLWTLIAGVCGILIGVSQFIAQIRSNPEAQIDFEEILALEELDPDEVRIGEVYDQVLDNRFNIDQEITLNPFREQMRTASRSEKLNILRVVGQSYGPEFADVMQTALVSSDAAIRVMAATVSAKIKQDYTTAIQQSVASLEQNPESVDCRVALAQAYLNFAESGILGDDLAESQQTQARQVLDPIGLSLNDVRAPVHMV